LEHGLGDVLDIFDCEVGLGEAPAGEPVDLEVKKARHQPSLRAGGFIAPSER
jgi:hypothetical protein